jgi:pimeloyl-ACP methyl ester carboxylesterase
MLAIREEGAGDPLVLVHGAGTSAAIWHCVIPRLAADRRVVAPDLPGYGASPAAGPGFALEEVADGLVAGLEEAGVPAPYDLVGHSMGGAIAILLAARRPERVRRLVLVAPAGLAALPRVAAGLLGAVAAPFAVARRTLATPLAGSALVRRLALAGVARDGARVPAANARAVLASSAGATRIGPGLASAATADLRATLADVKTPLGLVWGEHDPVIPRGASRSSAARDPTRSCGSCPTRRTRRCSSARTPSARRSKPCSRNSTANGTATSVRRGARIVPFCRLFVMTPVAREGAVPLPDGRRLAWSSGGDDDGVPVLSLHGAIGTPVRRTTELDLLIAELGIRYLAVSRPGFGRSDPCPGRRIADFPADVEHLADRLGLGRFTIVGPSSTPARWQRPSRAAARSSTPRTATSSSAAAWPRCWARWSRRLSRRRPAPRRPRSPPEARRAGAGPGSSDGRTDR